MSFDFSELSVNRCKDIHTEKHTFSIPNKKKPNY